MTAPLTGHCLCGAVALRAAGVRPAVGACHCRMCQRWAGGAFLHVNARDVEAEGPVARYRSSSFGERAFCAACGSHLWGREIGPSADGFELPPGLFDALRDAPLAREIYSDRALASAPLTGAAERLTRAAYEADRPHVEHAP